MEFIQKFKERISKDAREHRAAERRKIKLLDIERQIEVEKENKQIRDAQKKLKAIKNQDKPKIDLKSFVNKILPKPQSQRPKKKKAPEFYLADKKESSPLQPPSKKKEKTFNDIFK